jgi:sulfite reductase (NADPH) flavoprotein alpha-component
MVAYFGYGSNIDLSSLRSKGVEPVSSVPAVLRGWNLRFNVQHWFPHEGGVGNIQPSANPDDLVEGMLHMCRDAELPALDEVESYGYGYDRITVPLVTGTGPVDAFAYVGLPAFLDDRCLPTQRYLNIIIRGAEAAGLRKAYIDRLRRHPVHVPEEYPPFEYPPEDGPRYTEQMLAQHPHLTALAEAVFDMRNAHGRLACLLQLFGGKDMTLFHVKRHDSSTGLETLDDIRQGRISPGAKNYLNAYLHEYARAFRYAGRYEPAHVRSGP